MSSAAGSPLNSDVRRRNHGKQMLDAGYQILPNIFSTEDCDALVALLAGVIKTRAGARHLLSISAMSALAAQPRLRAIAIAVLGADAVPFRITLFDKSGESNWSVVWHQDTTLPLRSHFDAPGWGPWSVKAGVLYAHAPASTLSRVVALRVHLDDFLRSNGPLRVIPGSHHLGVLSDAEVEAVSHSQEGIECPVPKGCVLVMRPLIIHSSTRVSVPAQRRVLHIEYADSLTPEPGVQLAAA